MVRFLCLLSDRENLRDVVFFPFMRPLEGLADQDEDDEAAHDAPEG